LSDEVLSALALFESIGAIFLELTAIARVPNHLNGSLATFSAPRFVPANITSAPFAATEQ
jgi:hypothetical protein